VAAKHGDAGISVVDIFHGLHCQQAQQHDHPRNPGAIQTAFSRNLQLRKTRENLRLSERTLTHRLGEIQDLQARLQEQASRDPLTGLYNRRFLDTIVGREIARCHRDHR
jgi:hypothetical protein